LTKSNRLDLDQNLPIRSWPKVGHTRPSDPRTKISRLQQNFTESGLAKIWTCSAKFAPTKIYSNLVESTPPRFGRIWPGRPRTKIWSYSI